MSKEPKRKRSAKMVPLTFEMVRKLALALPKVEEGKSYGTPGFRVGGNLFLRFHQDGESLVVKIDHDERSMRLKADPETFYITDHYRNYPWILVRLATVLANDLRELLEEAWRAARPSASPPRTTKS